MKTTQFERPGEKERRTEGGKRKTVFCCAELCMTRAVKVCGGRMDFLRRVVARKRDSPFYTCQGDRLVSAGHV